MKRLWLILLSLGLIVVFSTAALAVDVKFSGEFYVAGMYLDKTSLNKNSYVIPGPPPVTVGQGPSTAFYFQRLRVKTDFVVSPGLTLVTRFDAMERAWGASRTAAATALAADSAGTTAENENIAFDWAYIDYKSPIGAFTVGLMEDGRTGTVFGNSYTTLGRIKYAYVIGPVAIKADITKGADSSYTAKNNVAGKYFTDADKDKYGLEGVFSWKEGMAGMKVTYYHYADKRPAPDSYLRSYFLFTPYAIAKIGPVNIQAEVNYATGDANKYEAPSVKTDVKMESLSAFLDATATFNPVYFGATFAYISGDDPGKKDKYQGALNGGQDWNPCLIMFNYYDRGYWADSLGGYDSTANVGPMTNAWFLQGRVGVTPIDKLDIMASVSYATADKKPASVLNNAYGYEADLTATYKITNNLSYMLGLGYFFTGDYYKGTLDTNELSNDYMVINKLTLTF